MMLYEVPVYRCKLERTSNLRVPHAEIKTPRHAADVIRMFLDEPDREHFCCLYLDPHNRPTGIELVSMGTQARVDLWVEHVFRGAVVSGCDKVIVAHNHPRGEAHPSPEDRALTKELKVAGKILGIEIADHIILAGQDGWYSFKDGKRHR